MKNSKVKKIDWDAVIEAEDECGGVFAVDAEFLALIEKVLRGEVEIEMPEEPVFVKPEDIGMADLDA